MTYYRAALLASKEEILDKENVWGYAYYLIRTVKTILIYKFKFLISY